jgi:hypothetical protein
LDGDGSLAHDCDIGAIEVETGLKAALFVVGDPSLGPGDDAVKTRLEGLGYTLIIEEDDSAVATDGIDKTLVVISSTVPSSAVDSKFKSVATPVVTWENALFDDLGMTSTEASKDFGLTADQTRLVITDPGHPLAAGLSGTVRVTASASNFTWGVPGTAAAKAATIVGSKNRAAIFGYEEGSPMVGLSAPARRVGLFMSDTTAANLTTNGWKLFEAAINWAIE